MARRKYSRPRDKSRCRFCREGIALIDYKDIGVLHKLTTSQGKLFSRKRSGNCAKCQRQARTAIKRARFVGLMPYVGE
ncbi:MAG: 30S ribosomal protein S18 [Candidatus Brocadiae bacterium]|nr:30S ribosomal protein S18 [Candidatus Brocadiia bacterium]